MAGLILFGFCGHQTLADVGEGLISKLLENIDKSIAQKCFEKRKTLKLHFGVHVPGIELTRGRQPQDYLLTRADGEPIRDLRGTWDALVAKAGVPGLLLHDFRRSAVRNMIRRGVPQKTAMKVSGQDRRHILALQYRERSRHPGRRSKNRAGSKTEIHSSFAVAQACSSSDEAAEGEEARKPS